MSHVVDAEKIKMLKENNVTALKWFYNQYSERLYQNALKITKDHCLSEDIVHDVFIKLWEKRDTIDPSRPLLNWLFVVSYNRSIDCLKVRLRRTLKDMESMNNLSYHSNSDELEEKKLKEENFGTLNLAIRDLSLQKRRVVELCKIQGKTYQTAADEMCISKYTVKEYLSDAMKHIRRFVSENNMST